MSRQQTKVLFSGDVQGVGFRYTACRVAADYDLTGYVRNCPDGQVECLVEGEQDQIEAFIEAIGQAMGGYIRDTSQQIAPYTGRYDKFTVSY